MLAARLKASRAGITTRNREAGVRVMKFIAKLLKNNKGATAIEYGLIAALIAVAAITAMTSLGNQLQKTFTNVSNNMKVG
jgi:pilus assembly protein Flp/PilA